jgi:hypothetical protein
MPSDAEDLEGLGELSLGPAVAAPALVREADSRLPKTLPCVCRPGGERYYASKILGRGAYGVVLRYESTRGGRALAVKIIHGSSAKRHEQAACAVPPCRGVVPQVRLRPSPEWEWSSGSPEWSPKAPTRWAFYVMPCMLHDVLRLPTEGGAAARQAASVVAAMARALRRLSRHQLRYHDVKPNNMLVDGAGGLHLGDLASVDTRASTYPPPMCLRDRFPWYRHDGGFVGGPVDQSYALNTAWALIVSFLIIARPGQAVRVSGKNRSVSRIFSFNSPAIATTDHGDWALLSAERLLQSIAGDAPVVLGVILDKLVRGSMPDLRFTLQTVSQLR